MEPQFHAGEYLVGIVAGYLMYGCSKKGQKLNVNKWMVALGWALSMSFIAVHTYYFGGFFKNTVLEKLYDSMWKELWVASICWIIFACHYLKSGLIIRWFLSQTFWQPLSKLALCTYLVHYLYLKMVTVNQKIIPFYYSWWSVHVSIGDIVVSTILAGVVYIVVEAPFNQLTNLMWIKIEKFRGKK